MLKAIGFALALASVAQAGGADTRIFPGPYEGTVIRVIDGDTLEANIRVWPDVIMNVSVRLRGIDAPEIFRAACDVERAYGGLARQELERRLEPGSAVQLRNVESGSFAGRVVADVWKPNSERASSIRAQMLNTNYVVEWVPGQDKVDWCAHFAAPPEQAQPEE